MAYQHEHVYQDLRRRLAEGEFPPGSRLPPIIELETQYEVATNTVRRALHILRDEGFLEIRQGYPTNVLRTPGVERPIGELLIEMGAAVAAVDALWQELRRRNWGGAPGKAAGPV